MNQIDELKNLLGLDKNIWNHITVNHLYKNAYLKLYLFTGDFYYFSH